MLFTHYASVIPHSALEPIKDQTRELWKATQAITEEQHLSHEA